jgi:hypothetical protein
MLAEELLTRKARVADPPDMDALTEAGALTEAQLLDVRVHALTSTVGLLFDLRTALQLRGPNTGIVGVRGVREFSWSAEHRVTRRTAWNVVDSVGSSLNRVGIVRIGCARRVAAEVGAETGQHLGEITSTQATESVGFDVVVEHLGVVKAPIA